MNTNQLCTNCGCTNPQKTYEGFWCKMCKNEMSDTNQQRYRDDFGEGQPDTVKRLWMANTSKEIQAILMEYAKSLLDENASLRARIAELEQPPAEPEPTTILGWLERLPDGYRERAIGQCDYPEGKRDSIATALQSGFTWHETNEGDSFWSQVANHYEQCTPLPPLPI
jgi:uncharacterized protein (DUF2249 family)